MLALGGFACASGDAAPRMRLPEGSAGAIVQRAIDAAGGWERWTSARDVAFVTTFTLYDPFGNVSSESIGLHKSPLHAPLRVRFESLGLPAPVTFGFDGQEAWALRDGAPIRDPNRLSLSRFNMVGNVFWFSLPFSLAEWPATITDLGEQRDGERRWERIKVALDERAPEAPGDWFVIYFDPASGLIDRVLGHITAPFLSHNLWVGRWLDFQDCGGIRKERRRQFFPADTDGNIVGNLVVEQLVEDVRFNNHFPPELFQKPLAAEGGAPT
jgi:hypothetical protein